MDKHPHTGKYLEEAVEPRGNVILAGSFISDLGTFRLKQILI